MHRNFLNFNIELFYVRSTDWYGERDHGGGAWRQGHAREIEELATRGRRVGAQHGCAGCTNNEASCEG